MHHDPSLPTLPSLFLSQCTTTPPHTSPSLLLSQVVREFLPHLSRVTALAWAPDSQRIATGSIDTNVALCNVADDSTKVNKGEQSVGWLSWLRPTYTGGIVLSTCSH